MSVADMAAKQIRSFGAEFGLTPSSEQKLNAEPPADVDDDDNNPFA